MLTIPSKYVHYSKHKFRQYGLYVVKSVRLNADDPEYLLSQAQTQMLKILTLLYHKSKNKCKKTTHLGL